MVKNSINIVRFIYDFYCGYYYCSIKEFEVKKWPSKRLDP